MAAYASFDIIGNLTRDVEVRHIASGTAIAEVSIAVNRVWYQDKAKKEKVSFFECVLWGRQAEVAGQYLRKGSTVHFAGYPEQDTWDDKETGKKRSKVRFVVEKMTMLGGSTGNVTSSPASEPAIEAEKIDENDVPF